MTHFVQMYYKKWNKAALFMWSSIGKVLLILAEWLVYIMYISHMMSVTWKLTCSRLKNWQFFGLQNCVKFVLFEVLSYIWFQNNQKSDHLSWINPSVWYTWQLFHHDGICATLFWTLNRSIFPQHSSYMPSLNALLHYYYYYYCYQLIYIVHNNM